MPDITVTMAHLTSITRKLNQLELSADEAAILAAVIRVAADAIAGGSRTVHLDVLEEAGPAGELNPSAVRYPETPEGALPEISVGEEFAAAFESGTLSTEQHKVVNHPLRPPHVKVTDPARR